MTINQAMAIILESGAVVLDIYTVGNMVDTGIGSYDDRMPALDIKYKGQTIELEGRDCFQQAAHYIQKEGTDNGH